jgi:hypothetical protein
VGDCGSGTWGKIAITPSTIFVSAASAGEEPTGSSAQPYRTIGEAIARAPGGARIAIAAGEYNEDLKLELIDADGRTTYHGYLHENAFDRVYIPNPWVKNGVNAVMALGIVATLAHVSQDQALKAYLDQQLLAKRKLHEVARDQLLVDLGPKNNYSGHNMACASCR